MSVTLGTAYPQEEKLSKEKKKKKIEPDTHAR